MIKKTHIRGNVIIIFLLGLVAILMTGLIVGGLFIYQWRKEMKTTGEVSVSHEAYLEYSAMLDELKEKKALVLEKEKVLENQAERIKKLEEELSVARTKLEQLRKETSVNLVQMEESEKKNLRKLAKMYGLMDPNVAAPILAKLDDETIVNILILMKERQAARLLGSFGAQNETYRKRAAVLSERMRTLAVSNTSGAN